MLLLLIVCLTLALGNAASSAGLASSAPAASSSAELNPEQNLPSVPYQTEAERRLLELINQARKQAGAQPLEIDSRLSRAARKHAADMARQEKLSHQLPDEAPLGQRLGSAGLHLDAEGENVAFDLNVQQAHRGLMNSPAHRKNLLNPDYNRVGLAVVRSERGLYVVEDFAQSLQTYPLGQVENMVAAALRHYRPGARLRRIESGNLRSQACSMAAHDRVNARALAGLGPFRYVLTYTSMQPELLPTSAEQPLSQNSLRTFAVGACYAQTPSYPGGAYFITVTFY